ncbi:MAG: SCO family protein [Aggregatilineales bacterium]
MTEKTTDGPAVGSTRPNTLLIAGLLAIVAVTAVVLFVVFSALANAPANTGAALVDPANAFDGATRIDPPRPLDDFTLTSHTGEPLSLSDLKGKPTLLYFGYTFCPDVCPITLGEYVRVKAALGQQGADVNFVMVSVDAKRDTPARLSRYLGGFDRAFIGMTGDEATLRRIGVDYGLYFEIHDDGRTQNYLVDHSASVYLIDPEMRLTAIYAFGTDPQVIVDDLRAMLG